ncbi:hypothetical protein SEA_SCAP1_17 [Streptomyces phage Scap1]|uniref:Uncharacterized protein n=1 Tax=Streptomyces phage Scap1 TaxID=2041354 RepID=A0A2D1GNN7_9CAUD|nr:hypothetical protein FDI71_gp17 [Streptomyces phage Scap1]ATN93666.1 hypothetical protein SEA_SCAP1_17 [Streptomyces phage Scap1]
MGLGLEVTKQVLDMKAAQAVLELRSALDKTEAITAWLANQPVVDGVDPLIAEFGYNADEAYVLRMYFEGVDAIRVANPQLIATGRKMTGLE